MDCPKCKSTRRCKDGIVQGRQRYLCKNCGRRYTVVSRSGAATDEIKRMALQLYLEGLGLRAIGRILKFSNVSILNWIRAFGMELEALKREEPVEIMELDEMHSYLCSKKTIAGYGLLLIEMGGDFSTARWAPATPKQGKSFGNQ